MKGELGPVKLEWKGPAGSAFSQIRYITDDSVSSFKLEDITDLGTYTLDATDANGCTLNTVSYDVTDGSTEALL